MIREVCVRLLGNKMSESSSETTATNYWPDWQDAALFLNDRIQASAADCPGRNADMSPAAAKELRAVLAKITSTSPKIDPSCLEAAQMLMFNAERVVSDIVNPGPKNIDGKALTQTNLRRVDASQRAAVEAMVGEVCIRLLRQSYGKEGQSTAPPGEEGVWAQAATYLSGRVQGTPQECSGRNPDMSAGAAAALKKVLGQM